jgi:calcium/calmodulin-dependent protein kinase I
MGLCGTKEKKGDNEQLNATPKTTKPKKEKEESSFLFTDPKSVSRGKVEEHYEVCKELGRGTFSIVKEGVNRKTGEKVALKFIDKKYVDKEDLLLLTREIDIMKKVNHENVLSLKEIYETENQLSLVMELVTGGELFFKIVERGSYSEKDAASIVRQIVQGVKYLHSLGIAHRDLKPENLLCSGEDNMVIKIADFGLSKIFAGGQQLVTSCGTPDYAAPEVLTGESSYEKSVDLWSVGVITYVLLCGFPPFFAKTQPALFEKIIKAEYSFPDPEWTYVSETAKDFIRKLLVLDPKKRLTAEEALEHPFLSGGDLGTKTLQIESTMGHYMRERKKEKMNANPTAEDNSDL